METAVLGKSGGHKLEGYTACKGLKPDPGMCVWMPTCVVCVSGGGVCVCMHLCQRLVCVRVCACAWITGMCHPPLWASHTGVIRVCGSLFTNSHETPLLRKLSTKLELHAQEYKGKAANAFHPSTKDAEQMELHKFKAWSTEQVPD